MKLDVNLGIDIKIFVMGLKLDLGSIIFYNKVVYKFDNDIWEVIFFDVFYFLIE